MCVWMLFPPAVAAVAGCGYVLSSGSSHDGVPFFKKISFAELYPQPLTQPLNALTLQYFMTVNVLYFMLINMSLVSTAEANKLP